METGKLIKAHRLMDSSGDELEVPISSIINGFGGDPMKSAEIIGRVLQRSGYKTKDASKFFNKLRTYL